MATRPKQMQAINAAMSTETALIILKRRHRNASAIPKIGRKFIMHLEGELDCDKQDLETNGLADQNKMKLFDIYRKYGIREDYQYSEILALCRFCCCLFWPSAGKVLNKVHSIGIVFNARFSTSGHPCIADQSPDYRARLKEAAGGDSTAIHEFQPVPPAQFLKYFSL